MRATRHCLVVLLALLVIAWSTAVPPDQRQGRLAVRGLPSGTIEYTPHTNISIRGDSDFTAANGVVSGTGTASDPFLIEGWEIVNWNPNNGYVDGIDIINTTLFFVIRNVYLHAGDVEPEPGGPACIYFGNVSHGVVENVTIDRCWFGIYISESSDISVLTSNITGVPVELIVGYSSNVTVFGNDLQSGAPGHDGAYLAHSDGVRFVGNNVSGFAIGLNLTYANDTSVTHNNFLGNTAQAQVWQVGTGVTWDDGYPSGGNFWSEYVGIDNCRGPLQNDCSGPDGIGDTPYTFPTGGEDRYPLMDAWPTQPNPIHLPIYINGDANFTVANGVVGGNGTPADPFLIAGWQIDVMSPVGPAVVTLTNTNATVLIEGLFINVTWGDPEVGGPNAVSLSFVHNVTIRNVTSTGQNSFVDVQSSSHVAILNSTATNPDLMGTAFEVHVSQSQYVTLMANELEAAMLGGIGVTVCDHVELSSDQVTSNPVYGTHGDIDVSSSSNVTILGETVYGGVYADIVQDFAVVGTEFRGGVGIFLLNGRRIAVDYNLLNSGYIQLNYTRDSQIAGNLNVSRIWLVYSPSWNTTIVGNDVLGGDYGIYGWSANDVVVEGNNVSGENQYGIVFTGGQNVTVLGNRVSDSAMGIYLLLSANITTFHNDFFGNTVQAKVDRSTWLSWNASYPTGGNYWSDYSGVDLCSGPLQDNCTGPDGIGDTPYTIDSSNVDHYPLMASVGNDTTPPVVAITSPSEGASVTSSPISVSGTAYDAGGSGLRDVQVRVNGGSWSPANGFATWNASVPLDPGGNVIEAQARDWAGNAASAEVNVTYRPPPPSNTPPVANFSWTPMTGNTSTVFTFTSTSADSQDPPAALQVRWDWESDGVWDTAWSTNGTTTHTFATPGTYNVTIEAQDTGGLTGNRTYAVTVTAVPPPPPPPLEAAIVASPTSGTMPLTVTFNSTVTGGMAPYQYDWHLGDGSTSPAANTVHIYLTGGNFSVWLAVYDHGGASTVSNVLWVNVTPAAVNLSVVPILPTEFVANSSGITVSLRASVSGGAPPYTFFWTFGDGSSSTDANPEHTYAFAGAYNVTVTVTDSQDHSVMQSFTLLVPACTGCGLPGVFPPAYLVLIVLGVAGAAASVIYLAVRWRKARIPP